MNPQPDPLAQLRDIHLPPAVTAWPPGPGWWVIAAVSLILLAALGWWLVRRHRANAHRRQAGSELDAALQRWHEDHNDIAFATAISDVLKRVVLLDYPPTEVAGLSGERWCQFLDQAWRTPPARGFTESGFATMIYSERAGGEALVEVHALSLRWLQQQRGRK